MELNKKNTKKVTLIVFSAIAFYYLLNNISAISGLFATMLDIVFPFVLGAAIAFIINVPMSKIEKGLFGRIKSEKFQGVKRPLAFVITLILVMAVLSGAVLLVVPELGRTIKSLVEQIPVAYKNFLEWLETTPLDMKLVEKYNDEIQKVWSNVSGTVIGALKSGAVGILNTGVGVVSGVVSGVANFVIAFIFSVYILMQKEKLSEQIKRLMYVTLKEKRTDRILKVGKLSNSTFASFVAGQCLEACILGFMFFIVLTVLNIPYAILIGVLIAITALIPIVGAFIGCIVGALLILMVSPMKALIFVIVFLVLQQIEGNLIYPRVVGSSVGLPSIWVLVAVTVGSKLMGVVGMIVFIPVFSVAYALIREFVYNEEGRLGIRKREEEKKPEETSEDKQEEIETEKE